VKQTHTRFLSFFTKQKEAVLETK